MIDLSVVRKFGCPGRGKRLREAQDGEWVMFTVRATADPGGYFAEVELVQHWNAGTEAGDLETIARGSIKWDGCANLELQPGDCLAHFCGVGGFDWFAMAMRELWRAAADVMPEHADRSAFEERSDEG